MSFIQSSLTINLNATLTDVGRKYLFGIDEKTQKVIRFNEIGQDLFQPTNFSLNDSDVNYNTTQKLQKGEVPDNKGRKNVGMLNTCANSNRKNFLINSLGFKSNIGFEKRFIETKKPEQKVTNIDLFKTTLPSLLETKIVLNQMFEINDSSHTALLYIDTDETTISEYNILVSDNVSPTTRLSSLVYQNVTYIGKIITINDKTPFAKIDIRISTNEVITKGSPKFIVLRIIPISNCDPSLITKTTIQINGDELPPRTISFNDYSNIVYDKAADGEQTTYIPVTTNIFAYDRNRVADINIEISEQLNPFRLKNLSIELLGPIKSTEKISNAPLKFSKSYIATLLENKQNIPLNFDINTDAYIFKITKPYLGITVNQFVSFKIENTYNNTSIGSLQNSIYRIET